MLLTTPSRSRLGRARALVAGLAVSGSLFAQTLGNRAIRTPGGQIAQQPQQQMPTDCAADGSVVDAMTGRPLARATVTLNSSEGKGATTDATGQWSIANITCGNVTPSAEKSGYMRNSYGRSPLLPQQTPGKPVTLVSG